MKEWKMRGPPSLMATSITGLWLLAEEEKGERKEDGMGGENKEKEKKGKSPSQWGAPKKECRTWT